ncbi:OmpA family protein, partial [Acinetobacter baumannii]
QVVIEGFADRGDGDKQAASLERANRVREQLVRQGVSPDRVVAVGRGEAAGKQGGVRFVEGPALGQSRDEEKTKDGATTPANAAVEPATDPIGTS